MSRNKLLDVKPGDMVARTMPGGEICMRLRVTEVRNDTIVCGPWAFSRNNGAEIDEDLGWGEKRSGTWIVPEDTNESKSS
jgi:hypothetical protein